MVEVSLYSWQFWLVTAFILLVILWIFKDYGPIIKQTSPPEQIQHKCPYCGTVRPGSVTSIEIPNRGRVTEIPDTPAGVTSSVQERTEPSTSQSPIPTLQLVSHSQHKSVSSSREVTPSLSEIDQGKIPLNQVDLTPPLPEWLYDGTVPITNSTSGCAGIATTASPGSKPEEECRRILESIYGLPFPRVRPAWLLNNRTGRRMELDGYCQSKGIAFEFNGEHHYRPNHPFNRTEQAFLDQVYRDNLKVDICDHNGVYLITIPYNIPFKKLETYIKYYLPEAVQARMMSRM